MSAPNHDPDYVRPIEARYVDALELIWLATARRLGLTVRRDASIFSMTDGAGLLALGPREDLDPDDTLAQMVFHELCHWITNGLESYHIRDWGFPLDDDVDLREHACLRLQAWLADRVGLRRMLAPTGIFRQYYDRIPADPLEPLDDSSWEARVVVEARAAMARAQGEPWADPIRAALDATEQLAATLRPFMAEYATEIADDPLPSLWSRDA